MQLITNIKEEKQKWEDEKRKFYDAQREIISEKDFIAQERAKLMEALASGRHDWEVDKEHILRNWAEETEILTGVASLHARLTHSLGLQCLKRWFDRFGSKTRKSGTTRRLH